MGVAEKSTADCRERATKSPSLPQCSFSTHSYTCDVRGENLLLENIAWQQHKGGRARSKCNRKSRIKIAVAGRAFEREGERKKGEFWLYGQAAKNSCV